MAKISKTSGKPGSATDSIVSQTSKGKISPVSHPLTRSQIDWLKLQSKHVAAASSLRSTLAVSKTPSKHVTTAAAKVLANPKATVASKTAASSVLRLKRSALRLPSSDKAGRHSAKG